MSGRPASHKVAMAIFVIMLFAFAGTSVSLYQKQAPGLKFQVCAFLVYLSAVIALMKASKTAYFYCASLLFVFPAFVGGLDLVILFKIKGGSLSGVGLSLAMCALLLLLFYQFTFGRASRSYYGFSSS